jgi:hypothetical protein
MRIHAFHPRQLAVELKKQAEERKEAEEAFYRNQELMVEAEKQRRDLILLEEQKLADQRVRSVVCLIFSASKDYIRVLESCDVKNIQYNYLYDVFPNSVYQKK